MSYKRINFFIFPILFLSSICVLNACEDEEELPVPVSYTTLVYMIADNSIMDSEVEYTISQLKAGAKRSGGRVAVYVDRKGEPPRLFGISQKGKEQPKKTYEEVNSADASVLADVIQDTKTLFPAEKFGLVLWSHGTGWLPYGYSNTQKRTLRKSTVFPKVRYIGPDQDDGTNTSPKVIEIVDLASNLPDNTAEYIWFDACLMGNIETLYELRNKCRYFVVSPTEVLAESNYGASGIPYSKILPYMSGGKEALTNACRYYIEHYRNMRHSILQSASIALIDACELDRLYDAGKAVLQGKLHSLERMGVANMQAYHTPDVPNVFFDMREVIKKVGESSAACQTFEEQLAKTVLYKNATDKMMDELPINPSQYSGLSMYVPLRKWKDTNEYHYYFGNLKWPEIYDYTQTE